MVGMIIIRNLETQLVVHLDQIVHKVVEVLLVTTGHEGPFIMIFHTNCLIILQRIM